MHKMISKLLLIQKTQANELRLDYWTAELQADAKIRAIAINKANQANAMLHLPMNTRYVNQYDPVDEYAELRDPKYAPKTTKAVDFLFRTWNLGDFCSVSNYKSTKDGISVDDTKLIYNCPPGTRIVRIDFESDIDVDALKVTAALHNVKLNLVDILTDNDVSVRRELAIAFYHDFKDNMRVIDYYHAISASGRGHDSWGYAKYRKTAIARIEQQTGLTIPKNSIEYNTTRNTIVKQLANDYKEYALELKSYHQVSNFASRLNIFYGIDL